MDVGRSQTEVNMNLSPMFTMFGSKAEGNQTWVRKVYMVISYTSIDV